MRTFLGNLVGLLQDFVIGLLLVIAIGGVAGWIAGENFGLKAVLWIGGVLMAAVIYNVKTYKPESRSSPPVHRACCRLRLFLNRMYAT
jgi:hypothetical protein